MQTLMTDRIKHPRTYIAINKKHVYLDTNLLFYFPSKKMKLQDVISKISMQGAKEQQRFLTRD